MKSILCAAAALVVFGASAADATVNIYISQNSAGVLAQTIGSLDLTGLSVVRQATSSFAPAIRGDGAFVSTGAANKAENGYAMTGPGSFGNGPGYVYAGANSGTAFALQTALNVVFIDATYVSGSQISSTATFAGETFFDIGISPGTYNYATANDAIIVHIGEAAPAAVPEPATWAMFIGGFGLVGAAMRRKRVAVSFV